MKKISAAIFALALALATALSAFAEVEVTDVSPNNLYGGLSTNDTLPTGLIKGIENAAREKRDKLDMPKTEGDIEVAELGAIYSCVCPTVIQASSLNPKKELFYQLIETELPMKGQGVGIEYVKPVRSYLFQLNTESTTQYVDIDANMLSFAHDGVWNKAPVFSKMLDEIIAQNDGMKSYMLFYDYFSAIDFYAIVFDEYDAASYVVESDGEIYDYKAYSQAMLKNLEELGYEFETVGGIYHPVYDSSRFLISKPNIKASTKAINVYNGSAKVNSANRRAAAVCAALSVLLAAAVVTIIILIVKTKKRV